MTIQFIETNLESHKDNFENCLFYRWNNKKDLERIPLHVITVRNNQKFNVFFNSDDVCDNMILIETIDELYELCNHTNN